MDKQEIVENISARIKAEYRKYHSSKTIEWNKMAAAKIYTMLQEEHLLYPITAYKPTFRIILTRILIAPLFAVITIIVAIMQWANWILNFIRFGGESIVYTKKNERKKIYDIYTKLDGCL